MIEKIVKAQQKLLSQKIDALLISSAYNIGYLTGFFDFSKSEREGYLLRTKKSVYIFASGLNSEAVQKHIKGNLIKLVTISPRTPLTKKVLADIIQKEKLKKLGFEKHSLLFSEYERLKKDLRVSLIPTEHVIEELRMIKTASEIAAIEKACKLGDKTFDYILTKIKPGITEKELAFEIEYFIKKTGADISFPPIVAFDKNSSVPHHVTNDQRLIANSWVLLDFGTRINNYCSDMTRTVFFGKANSKQRHMYETVLASQQKAIEYLASSFQHLSSKRKQVRAIEVDKVARSYIMKQGYPTIPHSLGHGIGIEVHEPPRISLKSDDILKPGMVFSVEPGIYLEGIGGVRIEDLVVLEKTGPRLLTKAKRELIEV